MGKVVILALDPWYPLPFGGTQQAVATLAEGLVQQSNTVYVIGPRGSQLPQGAHLINMGPSLLDRGINWRDLGSVQQVQREMIGKIKDVIRQHQRDQIVLHVHWSYSETSFLKQLLESDVRCATVLTKHTVYPSLLPGTRGWDQRQDSGIIGQFPAIAISQHDRRMAPGFFNFIEVITHGLPEVYFHNRWPRERVGGGCLGTYSERKGFLYSYKAAQLAGETRFESAGICNAPEHRTYLSQIQRQFLNKGFGRNLGEINREQKLAWLPGLRYFLVTIQLEEPLNLTVLEALASGTPVIAHDLGAMSEMIRNEKNGFLVPFNDTTTIAERIRHINALSPSEMDNWARRIRAEAQLRYSSEAMARQHMGVYDRVHRAFRG